MTKTFLTQKFAPEDMDKRRTLGLKLNRISDENAVGLLNDLRSMSVDELWSFVSKISEAIHVPVLNRLAVQVLPDLTGLRHDTTLRMIGLCVKGCIYFRNFKEPYRKKAKLSSPAINPSTWHALIIYKGHSRRLTPLQI
jgi:hypothetical protein